MFATKDDNFCYPIPDVLENDRVKVVPFIPAKHAAQFLNGCDDSTWTYLALGPFKTTEEFVEDFWEKTIHSVKGNATFIAFDKTRLGPDGEPSVAGMASYINSVASDLCTEIGWVIVCPAFQRTHVASNMVGLLMHYALDAPEQGGLGLRRLQWVANAKNAASLNAAKRMGFIFEGILRFARVLHPSKVIGHNGTPERKGDPRSGYPARDSAFFSCCWDNWESGTREEVDRIMARSG